MLQGLLFLYTVLENTLEVPRICHSSQKTLQRKTCAQHTPAESRAGAAASAATSALRQRVTPAQYHRGTWCTGHCLQAQHALVPIPTHCDSGYKSSYARTLSSSNQMVLFSLLFRSHSKDQHCRDEQDSWIPPENIWSPVFMLPHGPKHTFLSGLWKRHPEEWGGRQKELSKCHKNKRQNKSIDTHTSSQAASCQQVHPQHHPQLFMLLSVSCYVLIILVDGSSANISLPEWLGWEQ